MRKYFLGLCLLAMAPLSAAIATEFPGPYAAQSMIDTHGGVPFSLPGRGTFLIYAIDAEGTPGECYVSLESVADDLERSIATGEFELAAGKTWTIKLKKFAIPGRPKCLGPGRGCKVYVTTSSVDAPATVEPM